MRKKTLVILFLSTLLILIACRREEPEEVLPTLVPEVVLPTTEEEADETATAVPPATDDDDDEDATAPTATPEPVAPVVDLGLDQADFDWPPQLIYSSPLPGEEVLLNGAILLRFDQPMDKDSVEAAFSISSIDSSRSVSGSFTWPRPDTLLFTPSGELQRRQLYRVNVDEMAASANGITLEVPLEIALQTSGGLEISQVIPADGTADVQTEGAITVLFNRPVVPLVSSGQQSQLPQPLSFDPPVAGSGEWTSTSIFRFVPTEPLAGATTYNVAVDDDLIDVTGETLAAPYSWRFATMNPDVVSFSIEDETAVAPTESVEIRFNMPMDRSSTETAVDFRALTGVRLAANFTWAENDRLLTVQPAATLDLDTNYRLRVGAGARAASGGASLEGSAELQFRTYPLPAVENVVPPANSQAERWQRGVSIRFASPMNWDTVQDRIVIEPDPVRVNTFVNEFSKEIFLDFPLELNTEYRVTVPGDAADPYGNTLGRQYTWEFATPDRPAIASFNLPAQISQLSNAFISEVDIVHVNVSRMDAALYDLGLPLHLINRPYDAFDYRPAATPLATWNIPVDAPLSQESATKLSLANNGVLPNGVYLLTLDAPELEENSRFWQNQKHVLVVADTNIAIKQMVDDVHVWVTDLTNGQPVAGRNLRLYNEIGVPIGTAVSDANGFASFPYDLVDGYMTNITVISNAPGQAGFGVSSSGWDRSVSPWQFGLNATTSDEVAAIGYIYTDRPIYRPGDTMYYKGIVRDTNYGRYTLPAAQTLQMQISFISFFGGEDFEETIPVSVSADGTFAGDFALPADLPLGSYNMFLQGRNVDAARQFTVAEYRTPEFIVSLTPEQSELLRGEMVDVVLEASYLFGGAAADLQVEWNIYEEAHFLSVPGPYYAFGDNGGFIYEISRPFFGGFDGRTYLEGGSGSTDAQGRLTITLPADLLEDLKAGSRDVTVEANVFDLTNFPVASRTTLTMHAAEIYVGVVPENYVTAAGANAAVAVKTVDWDGQRVRNRDVEVVFYRREWIPSRNQDYGLYYTSWEPQDTEVARAAVTTDSTGDGRVTFVPDSGGQFIAVATVIDRGGREQFSSTSLWVTDSSFVGWQLDPREKDMQLVADAQEYSPGETAEILVQSPFDGPVLAWLTIERGTLLEQRLVTLNSSSDVLQIPITGSFAPNVYVSVVAIKPVDGTALADPYPDIRVGMVELVVAPEALTLDVTLTPQEDSYGPGETAVYDILVTDASGAPVQAELSLALVDLAVLTLKEDNAPPIGEAFYGRQPVRSKFGSGLIVSAHGLPLEVPLETLGLGGGGGDGFAESATARLGGDDEDIRADFPDTAFWTAAISTNAAGRATVEIPLPDNLTTWRLSSKAVTNDTLVGQNSVDIRTSLPLLVRPITPRFFTVGDVAQLGVVVNNNTSSAIEAEVSLDATGVRLRDEAAQTVAVPANGQTLVRWQVVVLQSAYADLVFRVSGGGFSDASRPTLGEGPDNLIPIVAYTAEDIVATAGVLDGPGLRVEALLLPDGVDTSQGAIEIGFTGSLAGALLETVTVNNDLDYSHSCPHALVNRVLPNVAFLELLDRLTVPELESQREASETLVSAGVSQLRDLALPDGGWGWCYSQESDAWISAQVVLALAKAEALGFEVDKGALNNGVVYLNGEIRPAANQFRPDDINRQAYYLYVLSVAAPSGQVVVGLDDLFSEQRALLTPDARAQMALAYQLNNTGSGTVDTLLSDVNNSAVVSATGTHWERESDYPSVYKDIISTAVVIQTLAVLEPNNPLLPGAVRWQMAARSGALWASSYGTTWSTLALTEWLVQSGELQGEFGYALDVNLQPFTTGEIDRGSIAETENISIPLSDLSTTEANFFAFEHGAGDGRLYYTLRMDSHIGMQYVTAINRGIRLDRTYFAADCDPDEQTCAPITRIAAGERVRVVLTVNVENDLLYAVIEDPLPAGAEGIDPGLATSASDFGPGQESEYLRGYWGWWYFNRVEFRDDKVVFLASFLPAGTYQYTYYLDTFLPGSYQVRPTFGYEAFAPEVNGRAAGAIFIIEP